MDQYVVILKFLLDEGMGVLEMGEDVLFLSVIEINPFVMLDTVFSHLSLNVELLVGPLVDDCEDTVDP